MTTTLSASIRADAGHGLLHRTSASPARRRLRRVQAIWALLILNVLTFYAGAPHILPIPAAAGKMITQFALVAALMLALSVNRPAAVRPSVFILLLSLLAAEAMITSLWAEFLGGAIFRTGRLLVFVFVLWLLTPWWGRRDLLLVKAHLTTIWVVLGSVLLGLFAAPGVALHMDRLGGAIWPIPPTQVGHYAAVAAGLSTVLWLSGMLRRELALAAVIVSMPILLLTHTRTALVALLAGVLIAGLSLFTTRSRVRKAFATGLVVLSLGALTLSSVVATWLARGQDDQDLAALTGRRAVWESVLADPRSTFEVLFGFGLSNKSFNGLPIDSNWLATYYDVGVVGVAINAAMLLFLLVAAGFRPQGPKRALALFLVAYCIVASFTETGLSDASPYLLELTLAASLLVSTRQRRGGVPGSS
jgi:hypothetical protein